MDGHVLWDYRVAIDLFLGGVGVAAFILSALLFFLDKEANKPVYKGGFILAPLFVSLGLIFLLLEIGRPFNAVRTLININPASIMSLGVFLQAIFVAIAFYVAYLMVKCDEGCSCQGESCEGPKFLILAGGFLALLTGLYHGMLLYGTGREAWNGALPLLFLASSIASGFALTYLVATLRGAGEAPLWVLSAISVALVGVLSAAFGWVYGLGALGVESKASLDYLHAHYGIHFYLVALVIGALVPLVLYVKSMLSKERLDKSLALASSVMILVGAFVLKYVVVYVGQIEYLASH